MAWQLQEAKQRFSEVVRRALDEGPQTVTRHGEEVVVVVSAAEWRRHNLGRPKVDLKDYILDGPDMSMLDLSGLREDYGREIDLT